MSDFEYTFSETCISHMPRAWHVSPLFHQMLHTLACMISVKVVPSISSFLTYRNHAFKVKNLLISTGTFGDELHFIAAERQILRHVFLLCEHDHHVTHTILQTFTRDIYLIMSKA